MYTVNSHGNTITAATTTSAGSVRMRRLRRRRAKKRAGVGAAMEDMAYAVTVFAGPRKRPSAWNASLSRMRERFEWARPCLSLLALVQDRLEFGGRLLELRRGIRAVDHVRERDAEHVAKLGHGRDHRQARLRDRGGLQHALDPFLGCLE